MTLMVKRTSGRDQVRISEISVISGKAFVLLPRLTRPIRHAQASLRAAGKKPGSVHGLDQDR
jgi:hypothetical protein